MKMLCKLYTLNVARFMAKVVVLSMICILNGRHSMCYAFTDTKLGYRIDMPKDWHHIKSKTKNCRAWDKQGVTLEVCRYIDSTIENESMYLMFNSDSYLYPKAVENTFNTLADNTTNDFPKACDKYSSTRKFINEKPVMHFILTINCDDAVLVTHYYLKKNILFLVGVGTDYAADSIDVVNEAINAAKSLSIR